MQKWNGQLLRKFDDPVEGNASVGTTVVVRKTSDNSLAVVYDVDDVNSVQKNNPFVTDDFGRYSFYAPSGKYTIEFGDGSDNIDITLNDTLDFSDVNHNELANRNAAGAHDEIYARNIDSIKSLIAYTPVDGQVFEVRGFYAGSTVGGGRFEWSESTPKSSHNGITVIAPEAIALFTGLKTGLSTLLSGTFEGNGCWLRQYSVLEPSFAGMNGDGTDDSVGFSKLLDLQLPIKDSRKGVEYNIDSAVFKTNLNVDVDFNGNTIAIGVGNTSFRCLGFISTFTNQTTVSAVVNNVNSVGSRKGVRLTLDDASAYNVGDHIRLFSDDLINPLGSSYERNGQSFEILVKSGNDIITHKNTKLLFTTAVRVAKHNKAIGFKFVNTRFRHKLPSTGIFQYMLDCSGYTDPYAEDLFFSGGASGCLRFQSTFRAKTGGVISGKDILGNTASNQLGYVIASSGTDSEYLHLDGTRVRHVYTSTAEDISAGSTEIEKYGGAINDYIHYLRGDGCHSFAADTHSDAVDVRFGKVEVYSGSQERGELTGGIQFRGLNNHCDTLTHYGNGCALFYNIGSNNCNVNTLFSDGGQLFRATGVAGNEKGYVGKALHVINDDNIYVCQVSNAYNVKIDEVRANFENTIIPVGTKQVLSLSGDANTNFEIGKLTVDVSKVGVGGITSAFVPVQFQTEFFGKVLIREYVQYNGVNVTESRGIGSFVQGGGGALKQFNLKVLKAEFHTTDGATQVSHTNPQIKTGSFMAPNAFIGINFKIYGNGFKYDSNSKTIVINTTDKFIPHAYDTGVASIQPYVSALEDLELILNPTNGTATATLQPPSYIGQIWKVYVSGDFSVTVNGDVLPANSMTIYKCDTVDVWTRKSTN